VILLHSHPSLILLNIIMQGKNTLKFLRSLKQDSTLKDLPVLIVTGVHDLNLLAQYLDAGAMDYFLKSPIEITTVTTSITTTRTAPDQTNRYNITLQ